MLLFAVSFEDSFLKSSYAILLVYLEVRTLFFFFCTTEIQSTFCDVFFHRAMMAHLSATCNHSHFARLFQKQLIQVN